MASNENSKLHGRRDQQVRFPQLSCFAGEPRRSRRRQSGFRRQRRASRGAFRKGPKGVLTIDTNEGGRRTCVLMARELPVQYCCSKRSGCFRSLWYRTTNQLRARANPIRMRCPVLLLCLPLCAAGAEAGTPVAGGWSAEQYSRKTIYHSPQMPGYTCWVGAWQMPDRTLMVTFKEVTGPVEGRPRAKVEWQNAFGLMKVDPARDFTGLHKADVYLRSTNRGSAWTTVAAAPFAGPSPGFTWGGSHCPLPDGAILRAVDGSAVPGLDLPRRV